MQEARFREATAAADADPELAQWWAEEQEFDRVVASKLESAEVPRNLKARLTASENRTVRRSNWTRPALLAAASIIALAVLFGSWRGPFQPQASLAEYRDEMVSFVRLDPPLELKSADLSRLTEFLKESGAPSGIDVPRRLQDLDPAGCRKLRFRGQDVGLLCFKRGDGELVHLFVINRKAMGKVKNRRDNPQYAAEGDWMTASWMDNDHAYLLATKGNRESLAKYFATS